MNYLVGNCADCVDGECVMNCSSAVPTTGTEHIAASISAGVFPEKATAQQILDYRARQTENIRHNFCTGCKEFADKIAVLNALLRDAESALIGAIRGEGTA